MIGIVVILCTFMMAPLCGTETDDGPVLPLPYPNSGLIDGNGKIPEGFTGANLKVTLKFPDQATYDKTKQVLMVMRTPPTTGDPCEKPYKFSVGDLKQGASLLDYPDNTKGFIGVSPVEQGAYTLLIFPLGQKYDLLCQTDEYCEGSTAGPHCVEISAGLGVCSASKTAGSLMPLAGGCQATTMEETAVTVQLEQQP